MSMKNRHVTIHLNRTKNSRVDLESGKTATVKSVSDGGVSLNKVSIETYASLVNDTQTDR